MGSDVYLSYKKSTAKTHYLAYKPGKCCHWHYVCSRIVDCLTWLYLCYL